VMTSGRRKTMMCEVGKEGGREGRREGGQGSDDQRAEWLPKTMMCEVRSKTFTVLPPLPPSLPPIPDGK